MLHQNTLSNCYTGFFLMLRIVAWFGFFSQYQSWAQQHTVRPQFPLGLWFRRNFCSDINFAVHLHNSEAKLKVKCKFSFLFGMLLPCTNVKIYSQNNKKNSYRHYLKKKKVKLVACTKPVTLPPSLGCPTVCSGVPISLDGTGSTAFPQHWRWLRCLSREAVQRTRSCRSTAPV